jgi:hypothetical protein
MFIYFVEQVWDNEDTMYKWNDVTDEMHSRYWDMWHLTDMYKHVTTYPTAHMVEGVDYYNY